MNVRARHQPSKRDLVVMGFAAAFCVMGRSGDASACGACYASSSESTVVNDHRMAFSIGKQQTVLWDSIGYSGNAQEFAYVLPAKPGSRLEASNEAWFTALDASTRPIIMGPTNYGYGGGGYDEGGGCGCGASTSAMSASAGSSRSGPTVQVVDQAVVGPYESVTVRSTDPAALDRWLKDHGYAIPDISGPIIASYVREGFDFIALRLRPGKDVRAMEPIRIVSAGTDTTLPLRLMQIGAGAKVGITLYVIGEGRYRTASFPDVAIDYKKLFWDGAQNRSNYQELSLATMATENGRAFVTEYADHPSFDSSAVAASGMTSNTGLSAAYAQACKVTPALDAGADARADAGARADADAEADADADADADAGADAAPGEESIPPKRFSEATCDDLDLAIQGMQRNDVWVTRLRANLPNAALADTLRLEAAPKQEKVENIHQTVETGTIPAAQIARLRAARTQGTLALVAVTALVVLRIFGKKKKAS